MYTKIYIYILFIIFNKRNVYKAAMLIIFYETTIPIKFPLFYYWCLI